MPSVSVGVAVSVTTVRVTMFDAPAKGAARAAQAAIPFEQFRIPPADRTASASVGARMLEFSGRG
jgi:hypothetical protein